MQCQVGLNKSLFWWKKLKTSPNQTYSLKIFLRFLLHWCTAIRPSLNVRAWAYCGENRNSKFSRLALLGCKSNFLIDELGLIALQIELSNFWALPIFFVEFFFDVSCDVLFNVIFLESLCSALYNIRLHVLRHVSIFDNCFFLGHSWKKVET